MQIFRNLMTESCSNKTLEYTYGADFPEVKIVKHFSSTFLDCFETVKLLVC